MKVYIKHGDGWLLVKEVYAIKQGGRKRKSRRAASSPYGIVAVSVSKPSVKGYRYVKEVLVPASKATRFAARLHVESGDAVVLIEPLNDDMYVAKIHARSSKNAEKMARRAEEIVQQLQVRKRHVIGEEEGEEEVSAPEEGEEEEEEE
ncbi:MAG: hypothetical protein ABWW70_06575 [Thermoproteota archaeon]